MTTASQARQIAYDVLAVKYEAIVKNVEAQILATAKTGGRTLAFVQTKDRWFFEEYFTSSGYKVTPTGISW